MRDFADWLLQLVKDGLKALWDFLSDLLIDFLDVLLSGVLALINALPVPSFLSSGGFQTALSSIDPGVWYFASHFHFGECFTALGAAVAFRLARKAVTLFQW